MLISTHGHFEGFAESSNDRMRFVKVANQWMSVGVLILGVLLFVYLRSDHERVVPRFAEGVVLEKNGRHASLLNAIPISDPSSMPRNLFAPVALPAGQAVEDPASRYKVTGIILDRSSRAVIRDHQENKSIFVNEGDRLSGFFVKKIRNGTVVVSMDNQEWELKP